MEVPIPLENVGWLPHNDIDYHFIIKLQGGIGNEEMKLYWFGCP